MPSAPLGRAYVEVLALLDKFPPDLKKKLKKGIEDASKDVDFDPLAREAGKGGEKAGEELEKGIEKGVDKRKEHLKRKGDEHGRIFGQAFITRVQAMLPAIFKFGGLGLLAGGLIGFAQQSLPALLASIPALALAAASSLGVLALATHGFFAAVGAGISGKTAKWNDALSKLAPSAQRVAREIVGLKGVFSDLQKSVQQEFFVPLQGGFATLARSLIPTLRQELPKLARDFGIAGREFLAGFSSPEARTAIGTILDELDRGLRPFLPLIHELVETFLRVGAVAAPFIAQISTILAGDLGKFLDNLNKSLGDGGVLKFFSAAGDFFASFGGALGSILGLLTDVLDALGTTGSPLLKLIGMLADTLRVALAPALPSLSKLLGALADAFGRILVALTPALIGIFTEIGAVFEAVADQLPDLVDALAPIIADIGFLIENYGPQFAQILGLLITRALELATQALIDLLPLFDQMLPIFIDLTNTVMPKLLPYFDQLFKVFEDLLPLLPAFVEIMGDWLLVIEDIIPVLPQLIDLSTQFLKLLDVILQLLVPGIVVVLQLVAAWGKLFSDYGFEPWFKSFAAVVGTVVKVVEALNDGLASFFNKGRVGHLDILSHGGSGGTRPKAYALGGKVTQPTLATIGEDAPRVPEAIIPMGTPDQARSVAQRTGLLGMLMGGPTSPGTTVVRVFIGDREITDIVRVEVDQAMDDQAVALASGPRGA